METALGRYLVEVDSERGGKVTQVEYVRLGRNLLFEGEAGGELEVEAGVVFRASGWEEAFPSVAESMGVPRLGWAWRSAASSYVDGRKLVTEWEVPGWGMRREISGEGEKLLVRYVMRNRSGQRGAGVVGGACVVSGGGVGAGGVAGGGDRAGAGV